MDATPDAPILKVENLSYAFKGHRALADVSFTIDRGSIHGFVGPNGAGKTTSLKIIATLLKPQGGRCTVFGHDVRHDEMKIRRRIGFMPDHFSMYRQMSVSEYLDFFAAAYGLSLAERNKTIADVLALTDMQGRKDDLLKGLSRGMQQRVGLARVLVNDPDLLLLDEPASGLDPRARIELMDILQELRKLGKTIFISSHILSELGMLCDAVTIIDRGLVKYTGSMRGLLTSRGSIAAAAQSGGAPTTTVSYALMLTQARDEVEQALRSLPGVMMVTCDAEQPRYVIMFDPAHVRTPAVLRAALDAGGEVVYFKEDEKHLNDAFMDLTEPGVRT